MNGFVNESKFLVNKLRDSPKNNPIWNGDTTNKQQEYKEDVDVVRIEINGANNN